MNQSRASRVALLAASSLTALALPNSAWAAQTSESDWLSSAESLQSMVKSAPVLDERIVTNDTVTPGPGNPATGANYANSPQVLSTGITGVGQMIAVELPFLDLCSGTLINP